MKYGCEPIIRFFLGCLLLTVCILLTEVRGEHLPVKIYTSADGLGSGFVDCLMRDSRGFMWFCTRDGLSRFDGSQFVTYQIGDKSSPPGIESMTETSDGTYWITTTGGFYRFKADALSQPNLTAGDRPTLNAEHIDSSRGGIFEDSQNNLWFSAGGPRIIENREGKIEYKKVELNLPPHPNRNFGIAGILESPDKSIWMNTTWGLVRRLPDGRIIFYESETLTTGGYLAMIVDAGGRIWLARGLELFVITPEPVESLEKLGQLTVHTLNPTSVLVVEPEKEISLSAVPGEILSLKSSDFSLKYRLFRTSDQHIWLTTIEGLVEFDGRMFHLYNEAQGFLPGMQDMAEDSAGNLWIGGRSGLIRLDRRGLTSYGTADGFHTASIHAITEGSDGTLYFADGRYYLHKFDGKNFQTLRPSLAPNPNSMWASRVALLDSRNEMWILTNAKLYRFAAADLTKPIATYTTRDGLKANQIFQIFEDSRGDVWVSVQPGKSENLGLARFDRSLNKFYTFGNDDGFPPKRTVASFAEDTHGNLWLGFYEGGLARYSNGRFTVFEDGLPMGLITDLHLDRNGRLWLSSALGGILRVNDTNAISPEFIYLTTEQGLSSNNVRTLTEDNFGRIYAGTASGVDRISPDTGLIKHYSMADGLAADFVTDSHFDRKGVVWFSTFNGLSRLVPLPDEKPSAPQILLGGLRIAGVSQPISELGDVRLEKGDLESTENNLQIDFFGFNFRAGETLRYQYRLEGADDDWSASTELRTVTYANLQPANYRFLVRAINSEGMVSENPAVVSFKILPPVWARWWFILFCALLVTAVIVIFYRYRTARLREINTALSEAKRAEEALGKSREERLAELEKVRSRIATDLHDDIGASLTQIAILSEVAQAQSKTGNGASAKPLSKISEVSNELVGTMSDIVWSINPAKDHLSDLSQRMRRFASDVLTARGMHVQFTASDTDREITINTNLRREVFLIFKESVNNIAKHSGAKNVEIALEISGGHLQLKITDDGKGFSLEASMGTGLTVASDTGGNGIMSMQKRAAEMNGEIEISSDFGKGTIVNLRLPIEDRLSLQV